MSVIMGQAGDPAWPGENQGEAAALGRVRVGCLDLPQALQDGDHGGIARVLWVSVGHPAQVAGGLFDEASFEGAWMEGDRKGCFRLRGVTSHVAAPGLRSPDEARRWLARMLSELCNGPEAAVPGAGDGCHAMAA